MRDRPKIAEDLPEVPEITEEELKAIAAEADEWRSLFSRKKRGIEDLTSEDMRTLIGRAR